MNYSHYEYLKQRWLMDHPEATAKEIEEAFQRIARKLKL